MEWLKALEYVAAFVIGLFARTAAANLAGYINYSMNGVDLLCGVTCMVMLWSFKGAFLRPKDKPTKKRRK